MISKEDIRFLMELSQDMKNQEHDSQAQPRFWAVAGVKRSPVPMNMCDGSIIYDREDGEEIADNMDDLISYFKEHYYEELDEYDVDIIEEDPYNNIRTWAVYAKYNEKEEDYDYYENNIIDMEGLVNALELIGAIETNRYIEGYYSEDRYIYPNTFFITKKECKKHIQLNSYHYNNPHTYAMTAWRSPQVARLWKILEETDWKEIMDLYKYKRIRDRLSVFKRFGFFRRRK